MEDSFRQLKIAHSLRRVGSAAELALAVQVNQLVKLWTAEIASEAERLAVGTGWLHVMFRTQETAAETQAIPESDGCADAEV